jgi:hypothetical protein
LLFSPNVLRRSSSRLNSFLSLGFLTLLMLLCYGCSGQSVIIFPRYAHMAKGEPEAEITHTPLNRHFEQLGVCRQAGSTLSWMKPRISCST